MQHLFCKDQFENKVSNLKSACLRHNEIQKETGKNIDLVVDMVVFHFNGPWLLLFSGFLSS
jgi:hypothetical protein